MNNRNKISPKRTQAAGKANNIRLHRPMKPSMMFETGSTKVAEKVKSYRTAMSIIKEMLNTGIISPQDYALIDIKSSEKYGLSTSTIFR